MCYMWALFLWLFFFPNQPQKQIFESVCLVLIKTKYDVEHWKRDLQWHKPMPAASAGFFLIVISRIDWLYFYQPTQEKSRMNVDSKYGEKRPITSLPAAFFSPLVFHLHSLEFPPKSIKYSFSLVIVILINLSGWCFLKLYLLLILLGFT